MNSKGPLNESCVGLFDLTTCDLINDELGSRDVGRRFASDPLVWSTRAEIDTCLTSHDLCSANWPFHFQK